MKDTKKQILAEIERIIQQTTEIEDLGLDHPHKANDSRVSNQDLYRILLGICKNKGIEPRIKYTGHELIDRYNTSFNDYDQCVTLAVE
jgi:hypothetical protein